jgi:hypothetical protein
MLCSMRPIVALPPGMSWLMAFSWRLTSAAVMP